MDKQLLDDGAEGASLGGRHVQHDDAHEVGALGDGGVVVVIQQAVGGGGGGGVVFVGADEEEEQAGAGRDLGDAVLPVDEELLVGERGDEAGDGAVVGDAGGVDGGEVRDERGVLAWGEEYDGGGGRGGHGLRIMRRSGWLFELHGGVDGRLSLSLGVV